jgi:signal transduction histidine kinase
MWTEAEYGAASERADDLCDDLERVEEAQGLLVGALQQASAAGDEAFTLFFQGELAALRGDYEKQVELQRRAHELEPTCAIFLRNIGTGLTWLGRHQEAIDWLDRALAIRPDDYRALRQRGVLLARMGQSNEALECFERALTVSPQDPFSIRNRAVLVGLMGRGEEAAGQLRSYLRENPYDNYATAWFVRFAPPLEARAAVDELTAQRRQLETERLKADQEAREKKVKFDAWRSLSARSAHRIGNQLFASRGALRTLRKVSDPEAAEAVSDLTACLERIQRIVEEFRAFSANQPPKVLPTQVGALISEVVRRYGELAQNGRLSADVPDGLPACLLDRDQIDQALGELLENAIHYTLPGGRIRVTAQPVGGAGKPRIRIAVEDTGPGVSEEIKKRLFEAGVTTRPGGSGLGLAIVKQIVENHGGTIRETGKPGEGARFEVQLPALPSEEARP